MLIDNARQTLAILKLMNVTAVVEDKKITFYNSINDTAIVTFDENNYTFLAPTTIRETLLLAIGEICEKYNFYLQHIKNSNEAKN